MHDCVRTCYIYITSNFHCVSFLFSFPDVTFGSAPSRRRASVPRSICLSVCLSPRVPHLLANTKKTHTLTHTHARNRNRNCKCNKKGVTHLLSDKSHAVQLCAISLMIEMIKIDPPKVIDTFRECVPRLVGMLKTLWLAGYVGEYDVSGITDPFLQGKIIQLLRHLGEGDKVWMHVYACVHA